MELEAILALFKDYDGITIGMGLIVYLQLNKKLNTVDKAVNQRPSGEPTISQEVSEIHRKIDVSAVKTEYLIKEVDAHRAVDEVEFKSIVEVIKGLHKRVTDLATKK